MDWRVRMVLTEGRNRQVRKMCWKAGLTLLHLHRVRIGNVELGDLPCGELREVFCFFCVHACVLLFPSLERPFHAQLSVEEVEGLYRCLDEAEREELPCGEGEREEEKEEGMHSAEKPAS